jgi:hypothetical protein
MKTVLDKIRAVIQDLPTVGRYVDQYLNSNVFTLQNIRIDSTTIQVYVNQVLKTSGWTYNPNTNKVTYTATLAVGDAIEIDYTYSSKYSDAELRGQVRASIAWLSVEGYKTFVCKEDNIIFPTPNEQEENLMTLIVAVLIEGDIWRYKTPEISLEHFRTLSKDEKIRLLVRQAMKTPIIIDYVATDVRFRSNI